MFDDGFSENLIEIGSFDFLVTRGVDFGGKFEKSRNVMAGFGADDENWSIRYEIKILLEFIENMIGIIDKVGFG